MEGKTALVVRRMGTGENPREVVGLRWGGVGTVSCCGEGDICWVGLDWFHKGSIA